MLAHFPRRGLSLDPLIAEAKRRMRRRRALLVVAAVLVLGGGAAGATLAFGTQPRVVPRASVASYPGPAVRLATCALFQPPGCRSPDRKWAALPASNGLYCRISVRPAGNRSFQRTYDSTRGGCGASVWIRPHVLLFGQEHGTGPLQVLSLDAATGKVRPVANLLGFVVSPDERWLAGELRPKGRRPLVAAISLRNHACHIVTQAHGPDESLFVASGGGAGRLSPPGPSPFSQGVTWIRGRNRHGRVSVANGPAVGFTRDSRAAIVAVNRWSDKTGAYYRRLVQIPLAASHRPCPAIVTAGSVKAGAFGKWPFFSPRRPIGYPLMLHKHRTGGRISSIKVTVNGPSHNSIVAVTVLRGGPYGRNHSTVFEERARMTDLPGHGDLPAGMPLATWTGTLSPSTWKGGCQSRQYEVEVQIRPLSPKPSALARGESLGSPWFRCTS